jgi:hypothetical protein
MPQCSNVLRVNEVEEEEAYLNAVSKILLNIQADNQITLVDIAAEVGVSPKTISNASNKKGALKAVLLKRLGQRYGCYTLDPYTNLAGGRVIPTERDDGGDVLPTMTLTSARIAAARSPNSSGGVSETLRDQLGYLPELRRLQREVGALIARIEARKDAA